MTTNPQPGECWRDRNGDIREIEGNNNRAWPIRCGDSMYTATGKYYQVQDSPFDLITRVYVTDWPDGAVEVTLPCDEVGGDKLPQEASHTLRGLLIPIAKPSMTDTEKLAIVVKAAQWVKDNPFAHPGNKEAIILEALVKIGGTK